MTLEEATAELRRIWQRFDSAADEAPVHVMAQLLLDARQVARLVEMPSDDPRATMYRAFMAALEFRVGQALSLLVEAQRLPGEEPRAAEKEAAIDAVTAAFTIVQVLGAMPLDSLLQPEWQGPTH